MKVGTFHKNIIREATHSQQKQLITVRDVLVMNDYRDFSCRDSRQKPITNHDANCSSFLKKKHNSITIRGKKYAFQGTRERTQHRTVSENRYRGMADSACTPIGESERLKPLGTG